MLTPSNHGSGKVHDTMEQIMLHLKTGSTKTKFVSLFRTQEPLCDVLTSVSIHHAEDEVHEKMSNYRENGHSDWSRRVNENLLKTNQNTRVKSDPLGVCLCSLSHLPTTEYKRESVCDEVLFTILTQFQ